MLSGNFRITQRTVPCVNIGYKSIYINGYWFQPQKAVSFFTKSYGKRLIAQTGIGAVISLLIDLIRNGLEKLSKK